MSIGATDLALLTDIIIAAYFSLKYKVVLVECFLAAMLMLLFMCYCSVFFCSR